MRPKQSTFSCVQPVALVLPDTGRHAQSNLAGTRSPLTLYAAVLLVFAVFARAEESPVIPMASGLRAYHSNDSEQFSVHKLSAELYADYRHLDEKTGLRYTEIRYGQHGWSQRGQQLSFMKSQMQRKTGEGWLADLGILRVGTHDVITGEANYRTSLGERHSAELFLSRDVIETRTALEEGRHFTFGGVSSDFVLHPQWTAVGLVGMQSFSDGNERRHLRGRLIYQPWTELGITLQARYRYFDSSQVDVGRAYFNPERYDEGMLAMGWRHRAHGWRTYLLGGLGRQRVNDDGQAATRLLEASAEKQENTYAIRCRGGYSRSAAFGGPDYRWTYVTAELVIPF